MIHEGGWTLTMAPDRIITWRSPDGTIVFHGDSRNRGTTSTGTTSSGDTTNTVVATSTTVAGNAVAGGNTALRTSGDHRQAHANAGAGIAVGTRAGAGVEWDEARRIVNDVIARRRAAHDTGHADTTRRQRRRRDTLDPVPLFGTDDSIQHRGPPQAS